MLVLGLTLGLQAYALPGVSGIPKNYPNPFRPSFEPTTINYTLTEDANTNIYIYNLARMIGYMESFTAGANGGRAGENEVSWSGKNLFGHLVANGVYIYFIVANGSILGRGEISVFE